MKLISLKLSGFKSFVDTHTVKFPSNIVGVVGPNGCGKSNIIDAVRWVMGESSAKNLRGDSLTSVIFNGSDKRNPVGQASVELRFDNRETKLVGDYAKYAELSIKRLVTRSGQSSYFINGTKCRRKDVFDIFLGTGLGPRSYSIIEQGMISRIVEAKPEELRKYIEEAAGISKYKERRQETESRILHTRENLSRVNDIQTEIEKQITKLSHQADIANKYKKLEECLQIEENKLFVLSMLDIANNKKDLSNNVATQENFLHKLSNDLQVIDNKIDKIRIDEQEQQDELYDEQQILFKIGGEVQRIEQQNDDLLKQQQNNKQDIANLERKLHFIEKDIITFSHNDKEFKQQYESNIALLEQKQEELSQGKANLQQIELDYASWEEKFSSCIKLSNANIRERDNLQSNIQNNETLLQRANKRSLTIQQELSQIDLSSYKQNAIKLEEKVTNVQKLLKHQEDENNNLQHNIQQQEDALRELNNSLSLVQNEQQQVVGELKSLQILQQASLQDKNKELQDWLQKNNLAITDSLSNHIEVATGWEIAIENVLSNYINGNFIDNWQNFVENLDNCPRLGQLFCNYNLLHAESNQKTEVAFNELIPLSSKLTKPNFLHTLLTNIFIAQDLIEAKALLSKLSKNQFIVLPNGILLNQYCSLLPNIHDPRQGIIQRREKIILLQQQEQKLNAEVDNYQNKLGVLRQKIQQLKQQYQQGLSKYKEYLNTANTFDADLRNCNIRYKHAQQKSQQLEQEKQELLQQIIVDKEHITKFQQQLSSLVDKISDDTTLQQQLETEKNTLQDKIKQYRHIHQEQNNNVHELKISNSSLQEKISHTRQNLDRYQGDKERCQQRLQNLEVDSKNFVQKISSLQPILQQKLQQHQHLNEKLQNKQNNLQTLKNELENLINDNKVLQEDITSKREKLNDDKLELQNLITRYNIFQEQITEQQLDIEIIKQQLLETDNIDSLQNSLASTKRSIKKLGNVNLAAIEELATVEERQIYYAKQTEDLEEALKILESAMQKIDIATKDKFKQTLQEVNEQFQELFPIVFRGGSACLNLTGDDLLTAGVSLMACPPGKKNSTIQMLSGGEKALTAITLVFAIFKLNPAPFCMLDEVDAPLDDANVSRYASLIAKMSETVQFIFITHNKATMTIAKQLVGVTMSEPGVSRLVAVDLQEAGVLAEQA